MNRISRLMFFMLLLLNSNTAAIRNYVNFACSGISESTAILPCTEEELIKAYSRLNSSYQRARERISRGNQSDPDFVEIYLDKLRDSQRTWVKLRDENCALESFDFDRGSVLDYVVTNLCSAGMSHERADFLDRVDT